MLSGAHTRLRSDSGQMGTTSSIRSCSRPELPRVAESRCRPESIGIGVDPSRLEPSGVMCFWHSISLCVCVCFFSLLLCACTSCAFVSKVDSGRLWAAPGNCGRLRTTSDDPLRLQIPNDSGRLWTSLDDSGRLRTTPDDSGRLQTTPNDSRVFFVLHYARALHVPLPRRPTPDNSGRLRMTLEDSGWLWPTIDDFGRLRTTPDDSGRLRTTPDDSRRPLTTPIPNDSGRLWTTSDDSGRLRTALDNSDSWRLRFWTTQRTAPDNFERLRIILGGPNFRSRFRNYWSRIEVDSGILPTL